MLANKTLRYGSSIDRPVKYISEVCEACNGRGYVIDDGRCMQHVEELLEGAEASIANNSRARARVLSELLIELRQVVECGAPCVVCEGEGKFESVE